MPSVGTSTVTCHCGKVTAEFRHDAESITAWDCNCSDCIMRRNVHFMVTDMTITSPNYEEETILYLWGTKTAKRRFCKTCGVLPWYTPRSNPDGFGITLNCVKWGCIPAPKVTVKNFDGTEWKKSFAATNIASETKK
mmetsp:Transcript_17262/g.24936  ORF Transcript_17262/g.24936 Transcript_17262/m.24936 type:complete len:137 (+) Transcript_17262:57-467(+)